MSKSAKASRTRKGDSEDLPFEKALEQLESIVESMEEEDLPLEGMLTRYEEGTRLVKQCQARLAEAELKIQKLEEGAGGELTLTEEPSLNADPE